MQYRCAHLGCHTYVTEGKYCQQHLPVSSSSDEDDGPSLLTGILAAEVLSEAFGSSDAPASVDTPTTDPTPDPTPDFGGFGGGDSGGGGAGGNF